MNTTGIGVATKVAVDSSSVVLSLSGTNTHQINAVVQDDAGTAQSIAAVLALSNVAAAFGGTTTYTGTITGGAQQAYVGLTVTIEGFTNSVNNGTFQVTASSATTLTVDNTAGVMETNAGTAAVYLVGPPVYISRNPSFVAVDAGGLITGVAPGSSIVEVSYPTFSNIEGQAADGTYADKVYAEIFVKVNP